MGGFSKTALVALKNSQRFEEKGSFSIILTNLWAKTMGKKNLFGEEVPPRCIRGKA